MLAYIIDFEPNALFHNNQIDKNSEVGKMLVDITDVQVIIKKLYKYPDLITNQSLRHNISQTIYNDDNCSPLINHIRSSTGSEYEYLLQEKLYKLNIPYLTEAQLRKDGYPKTPDIKLEIPFAYKGFIVIKIDMVLV
eukprot:gene7438-9142_t